MYVRMYVAIYLPTYLSFKLEPQYAALTRIYHLGQAGLELMMIFLPFKPFYIRQLTRSPAELIEIGSKD